METGIFKQCYGAGDSVGDSDFDDTVGLRSIGRRQLLTNTASNQ